MTIGRCDCGKLTLSLVVADMARYEKKGDGKYSFEFDVTNMHLSLKGGRQHSGNVTIG